MPVASSERRNPKRPNAVERAAAVVIGLEGLGLVAIVAWQIEALIAGDTDSLASALALIVLTAVGAAAVLAFTVAAWRGRSWGRSGGVVTQLLILAVAIGAVTGADAHPSIGLVLGTPAVVGLVLLVLAIRSAGSAGTAPRGGGAAPPE